MENFVPDRSLVTEGGLRQGELLVSMLFNIVFEKAVRSSRLNRNDTIFSKSRLLLAYADDFDMFVSYTLSFKLDIIMTSITK